MDIHQQITKYLTDAHSIEEQALQQLERAPEVAGEPEFRRILSEHLEETREHERRARALLEARDASPSTLEDAVMKAGGQGFILFARSQTDTPGKLAAHALSYEALEWASWDLLARTAQRAGEDHVAAEARDIRDQERTMMERIEGVLDRTAEASLEEGLRDDPRARLRSYLADAHALEAQSVQLLESGIDMVEDGALASAFESHLAESRRQMERLEERLEAVDGDRSILKDAALRLGAVGWGTFFRLHPDTTGKLAAFAYAFEHLEIGGYEQLRRVAEAAGDARTAALAGEILAEEREAARTLVGTFDSAVGAALAEKDA